MKSLSGPTRRRTAVAVLCALLASVTARAQDAPPPALPGQPLPVAPTAFQPPSVLTGVEVPVAPPAGTTGFAEVPVPGAGAPPTGAPKDDPNTKAGNPLYDSMHQDDNYGLKSLFDILHPKGAKGKWYEKVSIRGYTQFRFGRTLYSDGGPAGVGSRFGETDPTGVPVALLGDRSISGQAEGFSVRRGRFILFGDVTDHLGLYAQVDVANTPPGSTTTTMFAQMRDLYADVYIDKEKVHRFRVGLSKVPFGWENMQSSQNRIALDRTDPINSGVSPNERDLGVFYYWTPEEKQQLLRDLVDGGLKGSGNYGIVGLGVYQGQGGSQLEQNRNLHLVGRVTWPMVLASGQVVEASLQGYTGETVVAGSPIRRLGTGASFTPAGTQSTDRRGHRDQRLAGTFVWYPQPFGFQAEWLFGEGPGLTDDQRAVVVRPLHGGYVMAMYKHETHSCGIFTPYCRFQYYDGGYKSVVNAPYGTTKQWDTGVEWQIRKEMELVVEYNFFDNVSLAAIDRANTRSYRNFTGGALRCQFQVNY
ncbi:MAG: porin [Planctomycetes bacterium]|nr:porin [Planctomycetota bacterium]